MLRRDVTARRRERERERDEEREMKRESVNELGSDVCRCVVGSIKTVAIAIAIRCHPVGRRIMLWTCNRSRKEEDCFFARLVLNLDDKLFVNIIISMFIRFVYFIRDQNEH